MQIDIYDFLVENCDIHHNKFVGAAIWPRDAKWRISANLSSHNGFLPDDTKPFPDSKVPVAHIGPTWVLSAPGRPHVGPINLAIRVTWSSAELSTIGF